MALYQTVWAWVATVVGTLGVLSAYALRPTDQFVAVAVTGLSLGACAGCLFDLRNETVTFRSMAVFGLAGSAALMALLGLGSVFGALAVVAGVLLLVLAPWCLSLVARLLTGRMGSDKSEVPREKQPAAKVPAQDLDDATLLRAWRASSQALSWIGSQKEWLSLAKRRQEYLNELEKRDPRGFAAWLATNPEMDGDPTSFFHKSAPDAGSGDQ